MNIDTDEKYQAEAIAALDKDLAGYSWRSYIKKKYLLTMYAESKAILKKRPDNKKLTAAADSVLHSVIRITRCLCCEDQDAKKTLLRGRIVHLEAEPLYQSAERELKMMRHLLKNPKK